MKVDGQDMRPIWLDPESHDVNVIDQRALPHELVVLELQTVDDAIFAIQEMVVRGAPLIGITGAYAVYLAVKNAPAGRANAEYLPHACGRIRAARPTAVNLAWAIRQMRSQFDAAGTADPVSGLLAHAQYIHQQGPVAQTTTPVGRRNPHHHQPAQAKERRQRDDPAGYLPGEPHPQE